jgi:hypothetical protein
MRFTQDVIFMHDFFSSLVRADRIFFHEKRIIYMATPKKQFGAPRIKILYKIQYLRFH